MYTYTYNTKPSTGSHHTSAHHLRDSNISSDCAEWKFIVLCCQTKWWNNPHPGCAEDVSSRWVPVLECAMKRYYSSMAWSYRVLQKYQAFEYRLPQGATTSKTTWCPGAADLLQRASRLALKMQEMRLFFFTIFRIFDGNFCHLLLCQVSLPEKCDAELPSQLLFPSARWSSKSTTSINLSLSEIWGQTSPSARHLLNHLNPVGTIMRAHSQSNRPHLADESGGLAKDLRKANKGGCLPNKQQQLLMVSAPR